MSSSVAPPRAASTTWPALSALPGLTIVAAVVAISFGLSSLVPQASPLIWAMAVGAALGPLARRSRANAAGVRIAARPLLRAGVALLGLRISLGDLAGLGARGLVLAALVITVTMATTTWLARPMRVQRELGLLIATGSAICGASAIAAMESVTKADEEQVGYAIATVTIFGTLAMIVLPPVAIHVVGLSPESAGLWVGASIHEVAQVTGAGAAISVAALKLATLIKLARVVMLAPAVAATAALRGDHRGKRHGPAVPTFVLAFLGFALLRTLVPLPPELITLATVLATGLLAAALAGLGLQLRVGALRRCGPRPLLLGLASWLIAAITSLTVVLILF
jgi:uncharacterized integral membrane protein (TIGR00698 family)